MLHLTAGPVSADLDLEHGGRLASLRVHGMELLEQRVEGPGGNEPFGWGSYAMVPWAGRIRDGRFAFGGDEYEMPITMAPHAIHGTAFDQPWDVLTAGRSWAVVGMRLGPPWPFGGTVVHHVHLMPDRLYQMLSISAGDRAMPATLGWHPWFRRSLDRGRPLELDIDLSGARHLLKDAAGIQTGEQGPVPPRPWDDTFVGVGAIGLVWPGALRIDVRHDCSHVVLYDPPNAICVEPQSGPPNAFNLDPASCTIPAGDVLERSVTWRWTLASRP